jgi:hypothetical protein
VGASLVLVSEYLNSNMAMSQYISTIKESLTTWGFDVAVFLPNLALAIILVIFGIFVGKFVKWLLSKILIKGFKLDNIFKYGFIDTSLIAVKWVIYLLFLQLAFVTLKLPILSEYLYRGLGIIPGVLGAVVIVIVGYAIAVFLNNGFAKAEKDEARLLGNILFIFVTYISLTLALMTAFGSVKDVTSNTILIITALAVAGFIWTFKGHLKKK